MNLNISEINGKFFKWAATVLILVGIIKILERIGRTKLNALDFLQIDIEDFLLHRCCSAELKTAERFF